MMSERNMPPRRGSAGRRGRHAATPPESETVKATIRLSASANERLTIHAAKQRTSRSSLVEALIEEHLRRYVVSDRGERGRGDEPGESPLSVVA